MRALSPVTLIATLALTACWDLAENDQRAEPGNPRLGNTPLSDLAVSPDGRFIVFGGAFKVSALDLDAFAFVDLEVPLHTRFVFTDHPDHPTGEAWFLNTDDQPDTQALDLIDLSTGRRLRRERAPLLTDALSFDTRTGQLAAWSRNDREVTVVGQGPALKLASERRLVDVAWLPDGALALVEDHTWNGDSPTTRILVYEPGSAASSPRVLSVPNCASRLNLSPDGRLGLLAPTFCAKDPVSVIDIAARRFVENLPGFGPVAFSPDGSYAVAFGRQDDLATFGIRSETRYSLLFIDTRDLSLEVLDLGGDLPTYTVTPDGEVVLIYSIFKSASYDGIVMVDVATRTLREADGPELDLSEFVMSEDGELVYLIDGGLFRLDVATGQISYIRLPCGSPGEPTQCNPDLLNLLPNELTLVLGWHDSRELAFFDIPSERISRTIRLPD